MPKKEHYAKWKKLVTKKTRIVYSIYMEYSEQANL